MTGNRYIIVDGHPERIEPSDGRGRVIRAAERIRANYDPADWPNLHHGPITLERAEAILEWWWAREVRPSGVSSLDLHIPSAPSHEVTP